MTGGFRHRTARGCWPEGKVPSGRAAAKDAARRSMRRMYRDHGDWQKLRALFHAAKAALRAASQRTGVPVDDLLGRQRRSAGRFVDDRDHTTVLHSLRRMENRAAKDPELHAYMTPG
jgi:hypothetical protein